MNRRTLFGRLLVGAAAFVVAPAVVEAAPSEAMKDADLWAQGYLTGYGQGREATQIRAGEFHTQWPVADPTWSIDVGLHPEVSQGWTSAPLHNNTGILIEGTRGWDSRLVAYQSDGSTVAYRITNDGKLVFGTDEGA